MAILNYTTKIDPIKTIGEITQILTKHGASKVVTEYEQGVPIAVSFSVEMPSGPVHFSLPANYDGVLGAMSKDRKIPRSACTKDQAIRVSWRIIKDWIEAQMAIVEAELVELGEVFMPYAVLRSGKTFYQAMKDGDQLLLK